MGAYPAPSHEREVRRRFEDWSESYTFRRLSPWLEFVQAKVLDQIDWSETKRVLDVACGSGWAVFEAARKLEGVGRSIACGCDISPGMLRQRGVGQARCAPNYFLLASAQALPYERNSFDVVLCTGAFHHFPDPKLALGEFRRVLRPGGIVLIAEGCRDQSFGIWVWDRLHRWFEKGHVKYYRTDELYALLRQSGFESVRAMDLKSTFGQTKNSSGRWRSFAPAPP